MGHNMKLDFSDVLRKYAEESEISINQQIKLLNIDRSTYFKFLNGTRCPKYEVLLNIANILGIKGDEFVELEKLYYEKKNGKQFVEEMYAVKKCIETLLEKSVNPEEINLDKIKADIVNNTSNGLIDNLQNESGGGDKK